MITLESLAAAAVAALIQYPHLASVPIALDLADDDVALLAETYLAADGESGTTICFVLVPATKIAAIDDDGLPAHWLPFDAATMHTWSPD